MTTNMEFTLGQHLVQASIEKWKGYEEDEDVWKIRDEFLNCIVDELNSKCYYNSQPEKWDKEYIKPVLWNIFDVDYDIDDCKKKCVEKWDNYYGEWDSNICSSCETILDEKIRQPFIQTKSQKIREKIQMKNEIQELKTRLAKLEAVLVDKL